MKVVEFAQKILAVPSICPDQSTTQDLIAARLRELGFTIEVVQAGEAKHLWARRGSSRPLLVFGGHTDVVSPGALKLWETGPFDPQIRDGRLFARGAADMKGAIASMIEATAEFIQSTPNPKFSIGFLIVGDEEGASAGTPAVIDMLKARGEKIDYCLNGEPTSVEKLGDTLKIGRRGSVSAEITVQGVQGHVGYPAQAQNAIHLALQALPELLEINFDQNLPKEFEPSSLQFTHIGSGEGPNIIPGELTVKLNVRYALGTTPDRIKSLIEAVLEKKLGKNFSSNWKLGATPFLTKAGTFSEIVIEAIRKSLQLTPDISTGGGASDARFFADYGADVVELGLLSKSIHGVNEHTSVDDLTKLKNLYLQILKDISKS